MPIVLLDLPDLTLELITNQLLPKEVASCMLCCTPLRTMLQPRMKALLSARNLGRRWVLLACGRAIFTNVASRYKDMATRYEHLGPPENWDPRWEIGRHMADNGQRQFWVWAQLKAQAVVPSFCKLNIGCFFYVAMLAAFLKFDFLVGALEKAWERAVRDLAGQAPGWDEEWSFHRLREVEIFILGFQPTESLTGFFHGDRMLASPERLGLDGYRKFREGLDKAALDLLGAETMSTLYFVRLFRLLHKPLWQIQQGEVQIVQIAEVFGFFTD